MYSKAETNGGQFLSLIRFVAPPRDADKLMLKNGNDLWFYDPSSKASVRLSPQQRLLGQAANGDVVTVNLGKDYTARSIRSRTSPTAIACRAIATASRSPRAGRRHLRPHRDVDRHERQPPVKARFYAASGRLLKTAFYRHFRRELGVDRPTETVIIDGLDPNWVTVMDYADYQWHDVPDAWMQRDYLPHFRPD